MTYTANVIVNHPARITLKSLEQRFAMLGRDPADIGQRAIDAGLLLVIGDGAPIPENCGARDWAKAHYNGEDAHAITKPDYRRYCSALNRRRA